MDRYPASRLVALALVAAALLTTGLPAATPSQTGSPDTDTRTATHVLNRAAFGPRPGDVERLAAMGIDTYIDQQLHPERLDDSAVDVRLRVFPTLTLDTRDLFREYFQPAEEARRAQAAVRADQARPEAAPEMSMSGEPTPGPRPAPANVSAEARQALASQRAVLSELMQARLLRATFSERQLQEVLVDFWFNHFNVFVGKGPVRQYLTEYERDAIRPYVLGHFRDLLGAVAHSPAMLFYLDNWQSATPTPGLPPELEARLNDPRISAEQRRRLMTRMAQRPAGRAGGLNENYARELLELHTLGVDGGFTQTDVVELARILTGWTIDQPRNGGGFVYRPLMHDTGTKELLGESFGAAGKAEGEFALDLLARHPSTARHIAFRLAQRFVADEPPTTVVDRAAAVFSETDGDLREVVRSILTSPEFLAPETYRAKVKTPLEFVVSAVRATGATIDSALPLVVALQNLGMPLYGSQPPTGYGMTADAWVNTGALVNRMNFATALVEDGGVLPASSADRLGGVERPAARQVLVGRRERMRGPIRIDIGTLAADVSEASRNRVIARLLGDDASEATRQTLARAGTTEDLVVLAIGSPEFQRR